MGHKKIKSICIVALMSLALSVPSFAGTIPLGPGMIEAQEARLREHLGDGWAVKGNYALNKNTGDIYYAPDGEHFAASRIAPDGCYYQSDGIQANSLTYVRDKYLSTYDALSEDEYMIFDSRPEARLFVCWLQMERATVQGQPYTIHTSQDGSVKIKKSELMRLEHPVGMDETYQNEVQRIADSIPSDYSTEEKVNYATVQVANAFMYDLEYEKRSMEDAVRAKKGVCYHYARLLKSVLTELGIDSEFVVGFLGNSDSSHVWLKIRNEEEDRWVYRDPTKTNSDLMAGLFTVNIYEVYLNSYRTMSLI